MGISKNETQRETVAVTPPRSDTPLMRQWFERQARDRGFTDLRWVNALDAYGTPMGRLTGVKGKQ